MAGETIVFQAMLANVGGKDLYLKVIRDRDAKAINSDAFKMFCWRSNACNRISMQVHQDAIE